MSSAKKIGGIVASVLLWIVILLAALYTFVTLATKDEANVSSIAGVSPLRIQSDSMKPTFQKGDLIFVKKTDPDTLKEGDIVTFHTIIENQYALNTHRIVEIDEVNGVKSFVTKGDNNAVSDSHIIAGGDIVGKYMMKLPYLGSVMDIISSKYGFLIIIILPMLIFFIYQVYHLIMLSIELKKATAIEAALEAKEVIEAKEALEAKKMLEAKEALETKKTPEAKEALEAKEAATETASVMTEEEKARQALEEANRLRREAEEALMKAKKAQEELKNINNKQS